MYCLAEIKKCDDVLSSPWQLCVDADTQYDFVFPDSRICGSFFFELTLRPFLVWNLYLYPDISILRIPFQCFQSSPLMIII